MVDRHSLFVEICGYFGLVCGVYAVPDMAEVTERHESVGVELPHSLYMAQGEKSPFKTIAKFVNCLGN